MRPTRPRCGFSLIELLVVVAILGVLMALTGGAVQKVREALVRAERANWLEKRRQGETGPRTQPIRVLFIGNSYTFVNDLPGAVKALSDAAGGQPPLVVDSVTVGGAQLKDHWDAGIAAQRIAASEWDFVVLQEQSQTPLPAFGRDDFYLPYAKKFAQVIRDRGAIPVLYLTWARPDTPGFTQRDWTASVTDLARDLKAEVAAAGIAKTMVEARVPGFNFYADPGGHPNPGGTYIVACSFYATIFDRSPEGLPASVTTAAGTTVGLPGAQAAVAQKAASDAQTTAKKLLDRDPERRNLR